MLGHVRRACEAAAEASRLQQTDQRLAHMPQRHVLGRAWRVALLLALHVAREGEGIDASE
jgi:long-subunit acyl-CoA synthetase (AMP-forming)